MGELLRCPFCGGESSCGIGAMTQDGIEFYTVDCGVCGAFVDFNVTTESEAITAWNKRSSKVETNTTLAEWISVEERLPEEGTRVLVTYISAVDNKTLCSDGIAEWDETWRWSLDFSKVEVKITHWMPPPEPPKESQ